MTIVGTQGENPTESRDSLKSQISFQTIQDLPSEILHEILSHIVEEPTVNQNPLTFFPNEGVKVCHRWKDLITQSTSFWSQIVYFVGWTPLKELAFYLEWAGSKQDLRFFIMRTLPYPTPEACREKQETCAVLNTLKPFFSRAQSFHIHLRASSSLPSIRVLYNIPRELSSIQLTSAFHDRLDLPTEHLQPKVYLRTRSLSVNGHDFAELRKDMERHVLAPTYNLQELTITNLHQRVGIDLHDTMRYFSACNQLRYLRIVDIAFISPSMGGIHTVHITRLDLTDLTSIVTNAFLTSLAFPPLLEELRLVRCELYPQTLLPIFPRLILEGYGASSAVYLLRPVSHWEGEQLTLIECPFFVNEILSKKERSFRDRGTCCLKLKCLSILDCGDVKVEVEKLKLYSNSPHINIAH
ncbi:hypothetical protein CPB83DRAFT_862865 [Crepidotus variabilis]|uniref:F-box domain-containing protein n=1 Tax=Crepidotus variabilis TaxID=179855 RepID=A0A9P6JJL4_9AGAR|nr:hypothetical protein CPB83DRAFT_862865 [Crepidotus variabilis]